MIINKTKNTIIAKDYIICKNLLSKILGLMFTLKPKTLLFSWGKEKKRNIHMFFVFFPIDVLWLNKEKEVISIKEKLMPFSLAKVSKPAKYIIELPQGIIKRTKTEIYDLIKIKDGGTEI